MAISIGFNGALARALRNLKPPQDESAPTRSSAVMPTLLAQLQAIKKKRQQGQLGSTEGMGFAGEGDGFDAANPNLLSTTLFGF